MSDEEREYLNEMIRSLNNRLIDALRERDEARLLYCNQLSPADPHKIAEKWRWDCFKNEQEKFWDALDRVRGTPSRTQAMDNLAKLDEELGL